MSKKVLIVESPTKAKTIEKYLRGKYKVISSRGHIKDLPEKKFGVDIENDFKPKFVVIKGKREIVKELKNIVKEAEEVLLGPDPDREGEAIAYHIKEIIKRDDARRVLFYEITKEEILKAIENPSEIDIRKVNAQFARRILDRIVGYKISPILWKTVKKGLSAGRVQTVALRLIVEREKEIQKFKPQKYYTIEIIFEKDGVIFKGVLKKFRGKDRRKIAAKEEAEEIRRSIEKGVEVKDVILKIKKVYPDYPFKTSTLQEEASRKLGFSPSKTMRVAQSLFEGKETPEGLIGLITYHRTDSVRIGEKIVNIIEKKIKEIFGEKYVWKKRREIREKGRIQGAHEAIRPTKFDFSPEVLKNFLSSDELKLYDLIYRRALAFCSAEAEIEEKTVVFGNDELEGEIKGTRILFDGFLKVLGEKRDEYIIPDLNIKDSLYIKEIKILEKETEPPRRFTEGGLVKLLEKLGIGRPSTYAPILEILYRREYVQKMGKTLVPTELGMKVSEVMVKEFPSIFDVNFTAEMEENLDFIEEGKRDWVEFLKEFWKKFKDYLENTQNRIREIKENFVEKLDEKCPECSSDLVVKWSKYGKFIACSNFPDCKYKREYIDKSFGCPKCEKGYLVRRKGKKKFFYGCSRYPECDFISFDIPQKGKCPHCGFGYFFVRRYKRKIIKKCAKCGKNI